MKKKILLLISILLINNIYADIDVVIYDTKNLLKSRSIHVFNNTNYINELKFGEHFTVLNNSNIYIIIEPHEVDIITNLKSTDWYGYVIFAIPTILLIILIMIIGNKKKK